MPVVIEYNKIRLANSFARTRHSIGWSIEFNRRMANGRRLPFSFRIATTQVSNLQLTFAVRLDLIEQLDLIGRRAVCQYENFHFAFACLN